MALPEHADAPIGTVTSGNFSPVLAHGIALALLDTAAGVKDGDAVVLDVRGHPLPAAVVSVPFVRAGHAVHLGPVG